MHNTFEGYSSLASFSAKDGHHVLEIHAQSNEPITKILSHDQALQWATKQMKPHELRVLLAKPVQRVSVAGLTYPFHETQLKMIAEALRIPAAFVDFATAHTSVSMDFEHGENEQVSSPQYVGVSSILGPLSMAISFDVNAKSTTCLVLGLCDHQAEKLLRYIVRDRHLGDHGVLLAITWLSILSETRASRVTGRKHTILQTELELGTHWLTDGTLRPLRDIDFAKLTRRQVTLGSECAWDLHAIEALQDLLNLVRNVKHSLASGGGMSGGDTLDARLRNSEQLLKGLRNWAILNQRRIKVQMQTVYSLISQRDNELSHTTAAASQRIAEAAHRDGQVMKQLAEDSKSISSQTWRDGVNVRIMTTINLMTLPGTFVATFFSTTFFDFHNDNPGNVTSNWIWLYFVITVGLSTVILLMWHLATRRLSKRGPTDNPKSVNTPSEEETSLEMDHTPPPPPPPSQGHSTRPLPSTTSDPRRGSLVELINAHPERSYWETWSALGSQSFKPGAKSCAMCAVPVDDTS